MELTLSRTATAPRSEQSLVAAARRGDDRAFEALYATYRERVAGFIYSKVRDYGRAEDIAQDVFISALRQLRSSEQEIVFKPWIFAIAKNACIDEFRRASRGREVAVENDDDFPAGASASRSLVPSPPAAIESKQSLEDLRGAFTGLSESHHKLLVMRELEGRSYDEIGTTLGMTRQMVESGLFRARRKLTEEYADLTSGRRCEQVQTVIDSGAALRLKALGIKERRRLSQHLSHCQPCRHHARMAGVDEALLKPRSIAAKIAALLPFGGLWRWPWRRGGSATHAASGHLAASGATGAAQAAGAAGTSMTLAQAAAGVAALAIAGAGGGIAIARHDHHVHARPGRGHQHSLSHHAGSAAGAASAPATGGAAAAQRSGAANAGTRGHGARATATAVRTGPRTLGTGRHPSGAATGAKSVTHRQNRPTGGGSSSTSSTSAGSAGSGPSGTTAKSLVSSTLSGTGQTLGKVTAPVNKTVSQVTAPVEKAINQVAAPVNKTVNQVTAPVNKTVNQVAAPVKKAVSQVTAPVQRVLSTPVVTPTSSGGSGSSATSGGSSNASGPDPVTTVTKVLSGL
jgi:RNA polymerase sigma factor (sigma-70 family)